MFGVICRALRTSAAYLAVISAFSLIAIAAPTAASAAEVIVTITKFKALDRADDLSDGDFFAKITIDGKSAFSPTLSGQKTFEPNWKLSLPVPSKRGKIEVKLQLVDKDVSVDDPIDINRVAKKRDLDFVVNANNCRIEGFSSDYKCGQVITRSGTENKKAEISFTVSYKK